MVLCDKLNQSMFHFLRQDRQIQPCVSNDLIWNIIINDDMNRFVALSDLARIPHVLTPHSLLLVCR